MAATSGGRSPVNEPVREPTRGPFFFVGIVATILLIGATLFTLRDILTKGRIEQWGYVFEDAHVLPERQIEMPQPEGAVRVYYRGRDDLLAPYVFRLRHELKIRERERVVLTRIFEPPPHPRLEPIIPKGTALRAFYVIDRAAYLDVTREFLNPPERTPEAERLAVYALVNAIVLNSEEIDAVQILVEGRSIRSAWGWMDCSTPLAANLSVIQ
jgi:hypothetical protein